MLCTDTCITPVGNATGTVKPMTRTPLSLALRRSMSGAQRARAVWNTLIDRHQGTTVPPYRTVVMLRFCDPKSHSIAVQGKHHPSRNILWVLSMRVTAVPLGRSARSLSYELAKLSRQSEQHHLSSLLLMGVSFIFTQGRGFHDLGKEAVTFQDVLQTEKSACKHGSRILPIITVRCITLALARPSSDHESREEPLSRQRSHFTSDRLGEVDDAGTTTKVGRLVSPLRLASRPWLPYTCTSSSEARSFRYLGG